MEHINIRGLAKELNLSIGTVSKALRDSHEISAQTKKRVRALAHRFHYTPNPYASSLRRKKSNTIAVVVPEVADSFFSLAIKGIEEIAQSKGYHVLIYLTYESYLKEINILDDFKNGRVDGVILSISSETSAIHHFEELSSKNIPLVFFDRVAEEIKTAKITTDDFEAGYKSALHLVERGCKRISFLAISKFLSISNKRMEGYMEALKKHNMEIDKFSVIYCSNDPEHNYNLITKALKKRKRPDGIIASVEKLITPVYMVCKDLNIHIPSKVKVLCFSNLPAAQILSPTLTTITQPAFEMGKAAATVLFKALEKRNYNWKNENIIIPSELIERESTGR